MGRLLDKRFTIKGTLTASTPVHVGGAGDDLVVDMPLARDGKGRVYIPGTSLTGAIRAWWSRAFGEKEARLLFGRTPDRSDPAEGHASYVRIDDAPSSPNGALIEEIRDGVGLDRISGAAADGIKYDRAVATRDASFSFRLEIDVPASPSLSALKSQPKAAETVNAAAARLAEAVPRFGALVQALQDGDIRFGAAKTRGLGRLTLSGVEITEQRFNEKSAVLALVRGDAAAAPAVNLHQDWIGKAKAVANRTIEITITWRPKSPVMSKSGTGGLLVDTLPFVTAASDAVVPIIAGSSIKGALRSHAERIWRTLAAADAPNDGELNLFIRQLEQAGLPNLLFGAVANSRAAQPDGRAGGDAPVRPGLGAVYVEDCEIGARIPRFVWDALISSAPGDKAKRLLEAREIVRGSPWAGNALPIAHAAIDRWTGGAADTALFTALELKAAGPHTIMIFVNPDRIACTQDRDDPLSCPEEPDKKACAEEKTEYQRRRGEYEARLAARLEERRLSREAALTLLLFTLLDVARGRVPLGFGTNRGLGSLDVTDIRIKGPLPGAAQDGSSFSLSADPAEDSVCRKVFQSLDDAWRQYWDRHAGSRNAKDKPS